MKHAIVAVALLLVAVGALVSTRTRAPVRAAEPPPPPPTAVAPQVPAVTSPTKDAVAPVPAPAPAPAPKPPVAPMPLDPIAERLALVYAMPQPIDYLRCIQLCDEILAIDPNHPYATRIREAAIRAQTQPEKYADVFLKAVLDLQGTWKAFEAKLEGPVTTEINGRPAREVAAALARERRLNIIFGPQAEEILARYSLQFPPEPTARTVLDVLGQYADVRYDAFGVVHIRGK